MIQAVDAHLGEIDGVVWDYEPKGNSETASERDLTAGFKHCVDRGLTLAVSTIASPNNALQDYGVNYQTAKRWCHFLMPQLYAQIFNFDPVRVEGRYLDELKASTVPVVPDCPHHHHK